MDENSIKFKTIHNKCRFEYRFGDDDFFFEWKTARLDLELFALVFPTLITYR